MARRQREIRFKFRYAVLGEGITEQYYLTHLKELKGYKYSIRPKLFQNIGIEKAEGIIEELISGGCDQITYLADYDTIVNQGKKVEFKKLVDKYKEVEEVLICDSMPSIEYWFLLHFVYTTKEFVNCEEVENDLKKYINDYSKKKIYLERNKWFIALINDDGMENAISNAENGLRQLQKGDAGDHFPYTKIHLGIKRFEKQKNENINKFL